MDAPLAVGDSAVLMGGLLLEDTIALYGTDTVLQVLPVRRY